MKYVVDVERGVLGLGGEMHADAEQLLLEDGSRQADLWGANYYPGRGREGCIEYTSLINIRPAAGNRSMEIQDPVVRGAGSGPHLCPRRRRRAPAVTQHASLTPERWAGFGRDQQILMIANEMNRASRLFGRDDRGRLANAYERVLRLADLTVEVQSSRSLRRELLRWRELAGGVYLQPDDGCAPAALPRPAPAHPRERSAGAPAALTPRPGRRASLWTDHLVRLHLARPGGPRVKIGPTQEERMARIGVAVIGAGFMGGVHTEALRRAGCEVVGVLGVSDAESTNPSPRRSGRPRAYRSLDELLDDPAVESVHIGTPNKLHFEMAKAGARGRQARPVREAAGHDLEARRPSSWPSRASTRSWRPASTTTSASTRSPRGPRAGPRRARSGRIHHVDRQLRAGLAAPRHRLQLARAGRRGRASCGRWPTSAPTGSTSSTPSPASRSRPSAPTSPPSTRCAGGPKGEVETFTGKLAPGVRRPSRSRSTTEDYGAILLRFHGGARGTLVGLAGDGGPQELPALRDGGREGRPGLEQREPRGAVDRPPRAGPTSC